MYIQKKKPAVSPGFSASFLSEGVFRRSEMHASGKCNFTSAHAWPHKKEKTGRVTPKHRQQARTVGRPGKQKKNNEKHKQKMKTQ